MTTLMKVEDDRDDLMKMSRDALWLLAKAHGVQDKFPEGHNTMHSDVTNLARPNMVHILRSLGIRGLKTDRILGTPGPEVTVAAEIFKPNIIDKTPKPAVQGERLEIPFDLMSWGELHQACRKRGIKTERTDNKNRLVEKLAIHDGTLMV